MSISMKAVARFVAVFVVAALSASGILTVESMMGGPNYVDLASTWLALAILGSAFLLVTRGSWRN